MIKFNRIFILLFLLFEGCTSSETPNTTNLNPPSDKINRECICSLEHLPDYQSTSDSFKKIEKINPPSMEGELDGKISTILRGIIKLEVDGKLKNEPNGYSISTQKVLTKVKNDYPELIHPNYLYKINREFYCAYYNVLCSNPSISDAYLAQESTRKMEEFRQEIKALLLTNTKESNKTVPAQKTENKKNSNQGVNVENSPNTTVVKNVKAGGDINIEIK